MPVDQVLIDGAKGVRIPAIGYGTGTAWYKKEGDAINNELVESIKSAIAQGYTHLDAAEVYGTEQEVGIAIKESGVDRKNLFVTTKVYTNISNPSKALDDSLSRLQLDYVDLYLVHAPFFDKASRGITRAEAWQEMDKIYKSGKAKSVGVSNFREKDLEEIIALGLVKPSVNQIEFHPYCQQDGIVAACNKHNIRVEVYSPLCPLTNAKGGPVDAIVNSLAQKYNKSPEQILLKWSLQKDNIVLTTTSKTERMKQFLSSGDFTLTSDEVQQIDEEGKKKNHRQYWKDQEW